MTPLDQPPIFDGRKYTLEELKLVIGNLQEGLIVADPAGTLLDMNIAALRMHGFHQLEDARKHYLDHAASFELRTLATNELVPPEAWPLARILRQERLHNFEAWVHHLDAGTAWIASYSGSPVYDEAGEFLLAMLTVRNVTERRQTELALAASEQRYRMLFDTMTQGAIYLDPQGNPMAVNQAAAFILGVSRDVLLTRNYLQPNMVFVDQQGTPLPVDQYPIIHVLNTGRSVEQKIVGFELRNRMHWLSVTAAPILDPKTGALLSVHAIFEDVTKLVEAEEALRASEARYRQLYEQSQAALAYTDALYRASRKLIGTSHLPDVLETLGDSVKSSLAADAVFTTLLDMTERKVTYALRGPGYGPHAGTSPPAFEHLWAGLVGWVMRTGQSVLSTKGRPDWRESPFMRIHRHQFFGDSSVAVVPIQVHGRTIGAVAAFNRSDQRVFGEEDLHMMRTLANQAALAIENARLQSETEARAAKLAVQAEELARSNADLEQFAYVASHDLQEPLRVVGSYVQLFTRRYGAVVPAEGQEFLHHALEGVDRMRQLIQDLLAFSRIGTRGKQPVPVNSEDALEQVLAGLKTTIEDRGAVVTADPLPMVMCDETQLEQLLQNLLSNAIKFCRTAPRIHLSAQRQDGYWRFSVQDNGIGVDPKQTQRIFQVFQRLHTREEYPGTGIGLAICKKIVERHGGQIWVEPAPDGGSIFYFTLPAVEGEAV